MTEHAEPANGDAAVNWLVSCDESGFHGARFYGFGSLWMAWQRRGDFAADIQALPPVPIIRETTSPVR